jgi:uncharacterized membrane protein
MGELRTMTPDYQNGYADALSELAYQQQMADLQGKRLNIREHNVTFWEKQYHLSARFMIVYGVVFAISAWSLTRWPLVAVWSVWAMGAVFLVTSVWLTWRSFWFNRWHRAALEGWTGERERVEAFWAERGKGG